MRGNWGGIGYGVGVRHAAWPGSNRWFASRPIGWGLSPHSQRSKKGLLQASLHHPFSDLWLPGSMLYHVFNKYTITLGGVLDEDVGHGTHQFAFLDDGAAAHALDDAAG